MHSSPSSSPLIGTRPGMPPPPPHAAGASITRLRVEPPALRAWRAARQLIERHLEVRKRSLQEGDAVQTAGERFHSLHLVHFGAVKSEVVAANGCQQVAGLHLQGDWVGFDGLANQSCACSARAMDTSEIWSLPYAALIDAAGRVPELLIALHAAMSSQMARDREWRFALATLPADARLADFLRSWAQALALRELRNDTFTLRLTRAEIGNYLGMTLETVSRSFSRLVALDLVGFDDKGRRHVTVPDVLALARFVEGHTRPAGQTTA